MGRTSVGESKDVSTARELVHRAFKTAISRGAVAPFCCMLDGAHPCGVLCDELTAAVWCAQPSGISGRLEPGANDGDGR